MNRISKRIKIDKNRNGDSVHSGHYMTSCLTDDHNEDTVEMPIASPDATNKEVPANTEHDDITHHQEQKILSETSLNRKPIQKVINSIKVRAIDDNNVSNYIQNTVCTNIGANSNAFGIDGSISGGLTLDKSNTSLKKLIYYIKNAYSSSLTSPKWKNFKGLRLQVTEKIRLNNVIWRTWFEQYGNKDITKRKRPLICQFTHILETTKPPKVAILEGKYWKRRLDSITNEYKKWREISRKQIKSVVDGISIDIDMNSNRLSNMNDNRINNMNRYHNHPSSHSYSNFQSIQSNYYYSPNNQNALSQNSINMNNNTNNTLSTNFTNNNINNLSMNSTNSENTNFNYSYHNQPDYGLYNSQNNGTNFNNNNTNSLQNYNSNYSISTNNQHSSNMSINSNNSIAANNNNLPVTSMTSRNDYSYNIISNQHTNKQAPYNNRCRSPSPGLFDFDLCNFSSDTLFSTYCLEDPKDQIFGTNPDLFQPDLMHLYPNFDFLELNFDATKSPSSYVEATCEVIPVDNSIKNQQLHSEGLIKVPSDVSVSSSKNQSNSQIETNINIQKEKLQHQLSGNSTLKQPNHSISVTSYSDLSNFNTLATVAAAQQPSISPKSISHHKPNAVKTNNNFLEESNVNPLPVTFELENSASNQNSIYSNKFNTSHHKQPINNANTSQVNSSSNTIRNLLAMNTAPLVTPSYPKSNPLGMQQNTGIEVVPSPAIQMPSLHHNTSSLQPKSTPLQMQKINENQNVSSLLSVILAPNSSLSPLNDSTIKSNDITNVNTPDDQCQYSYTEESKLKRGRKYNKSKSIINETHIDSPIVSTSSRSNSISSLNSNTNFDDEALTNSPLITNKVQNLSYSKKKSNAKTKDNDILFQQNSYLSNTLMQHQQSQMQQQNLLSSSHHVHNKKNLIVNNESSNEFPVDFSSNSPNNLLKSGAGVKNNSFNKNLHHNVHSNAINNIPVGSLASPTNRLKNDIPNEYLGSNKLTTNNLNSVSNSFKANKSINASDVNSLINSGPGTSLSRSMSRSNSVNSINTLNEGLSSAEQKRRCNIQHGFDRLQVLVPSLKDGKNSKASKAAMLQKTSEYIKELQMAREKRLNDLELYRKEIEQLSDKISECQSQLPANNGVSVIGNLNKTEKFEQKFNEYVKEKTVEGKWKFYLFSLLLKPLFDNFLTTLNTSSKEDMERTFDEWQRKYCNLVQLRPIASNALRHLSKTTSILTDASKLPEECISAALTRI